MQKNKLKMMICFSSLMLMHSLPASASINDCDADSIHCAYVTGLSNDLSEGRYIKMQYKSKSYIDCANNTEAMSLSPEDVLRFSDQNQVSYFICTDGQGNGCQLVGNDIFSLSETNGKYVSQPKFYEINLANVQGSFPKCNVTQSKYRFG